MGVEIERKFLLDINKWAQLEKPHGNTLKQGYVVNSPGKIVRVRIDEGQAYITLKGAVKGISRSEFEYIIPLADGLELLDQFTDKVIEKVRYCITFAGKIWEVDVFAGDNEGLIVAEIELQREDEQFEIPPWVVTEVTGDERYYNANLAIRPFKVW